MATLTISVEHKFVTAAWDAYEDTPWYHDAMSGVFSTKANHIETLIADGWVLFYNDWTRKHGAHSKLGRLAFRDVDCGNYGLQFDTEADRTMFLLKWS